MIARAVVGPPATPARNAHPGGVRRNVARRNWLRDSRGARGGEAAAPLAREKICVCWRLETKGAGWNQRKILN